MTEMKDGSCILHAASGQAGTNMGIYVFDPNLSSSDDDIIRSIRESIKGIVGYNYSVVIIPSDIYDQIIPEVAGRGG
ncbi:hypothetical protein GCM10007108_13130 [Thermogymnomonas acidicola]|uniref:Uncharacterized protein n=3 Tax=Thermogymnomonas acidicola TaxID=399579 RepID=A0AA37BSV7_9ARCH|nr:hypothetical protein GCM10007108_13130 [Thermogymnomonas acidicola]